MDLNERSFPVKCHRMKAQVCATHAPKFPLWETSLQPKLHFPLAFPCPNLFPLPLLLRILHSSLAGETLFHTPLLGNLTSDSHFHPVKKYD